MHFRVQFSPFQRHSFINLIKLNKGYDFNLNHKFLYVHLHYIIVALVLQ